VLDRIKPNVSVSRRTVRVVLLLPVLIAGLSIGASYVGTDVSTAAAAVSQSDLPFEERDPIVAPRENVTVMTGQGFGDRPSDAITAFAPDGRLLYYNDTYDEYHDVDPDSEGGMTVTYVAADHTSPEECGATTKCTVSVVERVNLTTGDTERLHRSVAPRRVGDNTHDVDRIGPHRLLVADIAYDRVYVRNATTGLIEWEWEAQADYPLNGGGPYPEDWTHVNDVENLPSGRVMVSLRNQDQVVFIDRKQGLIPNMTLGAEDDYSTLFEQHNPDYVPETRGGPAVLVADSENDRVVEYRRQDGSWERSWQWADANLSWPRDADRLPSGNTLIVDTSGGRVVEINASGGIVWSIRAKGIYDAERLGTGEESAGGESATALGLRSRSENPEDAPVDQRFLERWVPPKVESGLRFVAPHWMTVADVALGLLGAIALLCLLGLELWWRRDAVAFQRPIRLR